MQPNHIPKHDKKLSVAFYKLLNDLEENSENFTYNAPKFREQQLWNHEVANLFKKNEAALRKLTDNYVEKNDRAQRYFN